MLVKDLSSSLSFVSDSQDVIEIKKFLNGAGLLFDTFFVLAENGEYVEIYGMHGIVPYVDREVTQLFPIVPHRMWMEE